ncbi:MAG TPA: glycosyltransferase family 4 protein [Gemmatimonadaceae bacterium]|nr:glycosyltransferase family 4 protein [Gemmatimonadaceae bacterium]
MRIAFVCGEYPPGPHGGIGTVTQLLARALVRRGHDVRVVGVCAPDYPAPDHEVDEGVRVWRLRERPETAGWARARVRLFRRVDDWSRAGAVEIVEVPDYAGPAAGWPRLRVPLVARAHGSVSYFAAELGRPLRSRMLWLERASLQRADRWCAVSRYTAERTRTLFGLEGPSAAVLYNAVELPRLTGLARDAHRVVFAGTLTVKKGILALADAWPLVRAVSPAAELHVCGKDMPDESGRSTAALLHERLGESAGLHIHGHLAREALLRELETARVAVFPSLAEAFAMAPLEAMACGTATVYTTRGSGAEVIDDGRTGLLVEPTHAEQLAGAILRLLTDDRLAARLGAAGREHVRARFAIDTVARENEAFYERCVTDFAHPRHTASAFVARAPADIS